MKNLILAFTLLFSSSALARDLIVENISQNTSLVSDCNTCLGGSLVTTTTFQVLYASCSALPEGVLEVAVSSSPLGFATESATFVKIQLEKTPVLDCKGPARVRSYVVTTDKLQKDESYILSNPTLLKIDQETFGPQF